MGRVSFSEENKVQSGSDFPKLKLEKGEYARIVAIEEPEAEFVHRLQMPKIMNGRPVMVSKERKNGERYDDYDYDFVGNPICLGDEGILLDKGIDPDNCPACKMAKESDQTAAPQRRFAMHVVKYATKPGGTDLQTPFQASIIVWAFTGKRFDKLVDLAKEHGNLQKKDLLFGPCTNVGFQNYDINISGKSEWLASEERKKLVLDAFKENQTKDLSSFCGRKVERRWLEDDLDKIRERWRAINGTVAETVDLSGAESVTLGAGLEDLLATQTGNTSSEGDVSGNSPADDGDLFAAARTEAATPEPEATPAQAQAAVAVATREEPEVSVKPGSSGETVSFDDLLTGL